MKDNTEEKILKGCGERYSFFGKPDGYCGKKGYYLCPVCKAKLEQHRDDKKKFDNFIKRLKEEKIELRDLGLTYQQGVLVWKRMNDFIDKLVDEVWK